VLIYRDPVTNEFSTVSSHQHEAWLIKFPAQQEHPEVCAIEAVYAECLHHCHIDTPDTQYFTLPNGLTAFASKRFDRHDGMCIPMQSLAAFTGADFKSPGNLDYSNFLRAAHFCTNDVREKAIAFKRAVFRCLVPDFNGAIFSDKWKEALWDKFYTAAPQRHRQCVEQYKIVKRA